MQEDQPPSPSFSRARRWTIGFHVTLSILAVMAVVAMVNYLAHRHTWRFYASTSAAQKLSPLTLKVLNSLTNPVKVVVFFDRREPLFPSVAALIKEYQARCPKLEVEFVDYRVPGRAEAIRQQYKLSSTGESSRIIFEANGQVRTVLATELSDYGMTAEKEVRRTAFRGEQMFTSAILNVTQTKPVTAYFLQGHGEHDPSSEDDQRGYSLFRQMLENNNIKTRILGSLLGREVPTECDLLIIAGPEQSLDESELVALERYLGRGGRLFVLFSMQTLGVNTGLEHLLANWGIEVGVNWVQDTGQAQAGQAEVLVVSNFGVHPTVRPLARSTLSLIMPRSIRHRPRKQTTADAPKVVELATTSSNGRILVPRGKAWTAAEGGAIPVMAAAEKGSIQGISSREGTARLIVAGDSLFLSNLGFNAAANSDFANLAVNWLCNRDSLLGEIGPRPVAEYEIRLTEQQMSQIRWLLLAAIPGVVFTVGLLVWVRRRA